MTSAILVDIDVYRRKRDVSSIDGACALIEDWFDSLALVPRVREALGHSLGAILSEVIDGDERAIAAWKRIAREMKAPLRAREPGEQDYQRMINRSTRSRFIFG